MKNKHTILFNLILLCGITYILAQSSTPRYDWMYEFGKKPSSFCTNHYYSDLPTTMESVNLWVHEFKSSDQVNFDWIKLSASDHKYCVGYIWLKDFINFENGFVTEFNMEIKNPTCLYKDVKTCKLSAFGACLVDSTESVEDRCGADGFAVVLQTSNNKFVGGSGGGIGYAGASNVMAIEFDTWYNPTANDPTNNGERHISVIIKSGSADSNEVNSVAWNDKPLNFKSDKFEGFLNNPTFKIEYLNRNLRVFINNVLQLGYYEELDVRKRIPTPTGQFYLGITSATGWITNDHILRNWKVKMVRPSPSVSYVNLVPGQDLLGPLKTNQWIKLAYYVKDNCGNRYVPIPDFDKTSDFVLEKHPSCILGEVTDSPDRGWSQLGPSYFLNVKCDKAGTHRLKILYKNWPTSNLLDIKVGSGPLYRAVVTFPPGTGSKGTVDKPFKFTLTPLDQSDNIAETTVETLRSKVNVLWPNPAESKQDYAISLNSDGTYQYVINADKQGVYSISSFQLFLKEVAGGVYNFQIDIGKPSIKMSYATVVELETGVELTDYEVAAGRSGRLVIFLRDISGNNIPGSQADLGLFSVDLVVAGKISGQLDKLETGTDRVYYPVKLTKKGQNLLVPKYNSEEIQCRKCNFLVKANTPIFDYSVIYEYNSQSATFQPDPSPPLKITKAENFLYLFVLKDEYQNIVDGVNPGDYTATLSGNDMTVINLALSKYDFGVKLEIPSEQTAAYKRLVGRENYQITVTQTTSKKFNIYPLTIESDGSDADAGNGDVDPIRTTFQWVDAPVQNLNCIAGQKYKLLLTLNTNKGRRYNDYIDEARIQVEIKTFFSEVDTNSSLVRGPKLGTYYFDFVLRRTDNTMRTITFKVDSKASVKKATVKVVPDVPFLASIGESAIDKLNVLKKGLIFDSYNFDFILVDKFNNAQDAANNILDLTFSHNEGKGLNNMKPTCSRKNLGLYTCQFKGNVWGTYTIQSVYFNPNKDFQTYSLELSRGAPDATTTQAGITNVANVQNIRAGDQVTFQIVPKDRTGSPLTKAEVQVYETEFSNSITVPGESSKKPAGLTLKEDGVFEFITTLTKVGEHIFFPLYKGQPIQCEICAATINYNDLDPKGTKVSLIQGDKELNLLPTEVLSLDNVKLLPIFVLRFFDKYGNERPFDTSYKTLSAVMNNDKKAAGMKNKYDLELIQNTGIKFSIKNDDQESYKTEMNSSDWTLRFSATNDKENIDILFSQVTLLGKAGDEQFTQDQVPTPASVKFNPKEIRAVAGDSLTLNFELRSPNGKLFYDQKNKGWYAVPQDSLKLTVKDTQEKIPIQVTKGATPSTYLISFVREKSSLAGLSVELSFLGPLSGIFETAAEKLNLIISPADISYVVLDESSLGDCKSDTTKLLKLKPYDKYNNLIPQLKSINDIGLQNVHSDSSDSTQCTMNQNDDGNVIVSHYCKKVGDVTLTTIRFRKAPSSEGETVPSFKFKIVPGSPHPANSLAKIDKTEVTAGDAIIWTIFPVDVNGNAIKLDVNNEEHKKSLFSNIQTLPGENAPIVNLNSEDLKLAVGDGSYSIQVKLTLTGTHNFKALYKNQLISSTTFRVRVTPDSPVYEKSLLSKLDSKLQTFVLAENSPEFKFIHNIESLPVFKVVLFDQFDNVFPYVPDGWGFNLTLTNKELELSGEIMFHRDPNDTFKIVNLDDVKKWGDLITNKDYALELEKGTQKRVFGMNLIGDPVDPDASNLPLEVQNTLITPMKSLETRANVPISFNVEFRTTDKNLRVNSWITPIDKLRSSVILRFSKNDADDDLVFYEVGYGDKKGRYIVTVTSKLSYTAANPNSITLIVNSIEFSGYKPNLVVLPGTIEKVEAVDAAETVLTALPDSTVDQLYSVLFKAWDAWGNVVPLTSEKNINLDLQDATGATIVFDKAITGNALVRISFQPKAPGVFVYNLTKGKLLNAKITQGEISTDTSFCTLVGTGEISLTAGEKVTLRFHPLDKWGNQLSLTDAQRKDNIFSYYYKRPDIVEGFVLGENSEIKPVEATNVRFEQVLTAKGVNRFKCSINSVEIAIKIANALVKPGQPSLANSILNTFDVDSGYYIRLFENIEFKEDNRNTNFVPRFKLVLADMYGNELDTFPEADQTKYSMRLYGHTITKEAPVLYKTDGVLGNGLVFTLKGDDHMQVYRASLYRESPYTLELYNNVGVPQPEVRLFKVILLGDGKDDTSASLNVPLDVNKTFISKSSLKFTAGESDSFFIELRDDKGMRKADANVEFKIKVNANNDDKKYRAVFEKGDKRGRFIATIFGERSNHRGAPLLVTLIVVDKGISVTSNVDQEVPQVISVVITPAGMKSIKIGDESSLSVGSTADDDFVFSVVPYDQFNNVADVLAESINLNVVFPERNKGQQGGNVWNAKLDSKTGYVIYTVGCRISGDYIIKSQLLSENKYFKVAPGAPSAKFSTVVVSPTGLNAGESVSVRITAVDAYNNLIDPSGKANLVESFVLRASLNDEAKNYTLVANTKEKTLETSFSYTKVGLVTVVALVRGDPIACDSCTVTYNPSSIDIKRSKFLVQVTGDLFKDAPFVEIPASTSSLDLVVKLFDRFENPIQTIYSNESFALSLSGHDMDEITFVQSLSGASPKFTLSADDQKRLAILVPAMGYQLRLSYLRDQKAVDNIDLAMNILGDADGAGNGAWVAPNTWVSDPFADVTAGNEKFINLELRTKKELRYNGELDPSLIVGVELPKSAGSEKLQIKIYRGNKPGRYVLGLYGTKALTGEQDKKYISVTIDGKDINREIVVDVIPNNPVLGKTKIIQNFPEFGVMTDTTHPIIFQLFDRYDNQFTKTKFGPSLKAKAIRGFALFNSTSMSGSNYVITVTPVYPPRILELQINYFNQETNETVLVNQENLLTQVNTTLEPSKTEIIGTALGGVSVSEAFNFQVLLKDVKGYCFEQEAAVSVIIRGPYLDSVVDSVNRDANIPMIELKKEAKSEKPFVNTDSSAGNNTPKSNAEKNEDNLFKEGTSQCMQLFNVSVAGEEMFKVGYYQIDVLIKGQNADKPVKKIRKTYMTPGAMSLQKSIISVPALYNRAVVKISYPVNTPMVFHVQPHDKFSNEIQVLREADVVSFALPGLDSKFYSSSVEHFANGTYKVTATIFKTGEISDAELKMGSLKTSWKDLKRIDSPEIINITPGKCFGKNLIIDNITEVKAGARNKFNIQCFDTYNNSIPTGGEQFSFILVGSKLETINYENIEGHVVDNNNGNYTFDFLVTWPGLYTTSIKLGSYDIQFNITAISGICKDGFIDCVNLGKCVNGSGYEVCGLDILKGCEPSAPIRCVSEGVEKCVRGHFECDCPYGFVKCPSDKKCVPAAKESDLCTTGFNSLCPPDLPYSCSDGSCKSDLNQCPSQPGCPPGLRLCPDQTCLDKKLECPDFQPCNTERIFKCEDQTCVASPEECPSRIVCNNPDHIICPDGTCASSELKCKTPITCTDQMKLCPDQSCRLNSINCPTKKTCPLNYGLCEDGSCRLVCPVLSVKKAGLRMLARRMAEMQEENKNKCPSGELRCPGGECVKVVGACPTQETCPLGSIRCPDDSCSLTLKDCVTKVCAADEFHCWDGKCVKDKSQCSTKSTCTAGNDVKCPDGSCRKSVEECDEIIPCPPHAPYRCAYGACRASSSECPTLISCPADRPIQCVDGSCRKSISQCKDAVEIAKCAEGKILCPDGSCAFSKHLCPSSISCHKGQIRCWDGTCADEHKFCRQLLSEEDVCPSDINFRCPDSSCRARAEDCPTGLICPADRPILCEDGTCKESIGQCSKGSECSYGLIKCPDGSCASKSCGTPITCPKETPYRCYDNTCKPDPRDCPEVPKCSQGAPILCPDGTCASLRVLCTGFAQCDKKTPVRCPDFSCAQNITECKSISGCPVGKILCEDGSCAIHPSYCPLKKCPFHLPKKCPDGFCVSDLAYCDSPNGCPYNKPFKCKNGLCVAKELACPNDNLKNETICKKDEYLCPDGSCAYDKSKCMNEVGCPYETPLKCVNGLCVDPNKTSCAAGSCPKETPVKCLNGICVKSFSNCPSFLDLEDYKQCKDEQNGDIVPCADGKCVASAEQCKPLYSCPENNFRCPDGSCRVLKELCPKTGSTCPAHKPYRCDIGACAIDDKHCPSANGCPNYAPWKCENSGTCANDTTKCPTIYSKTILPNLCTIDKPYRCNNKKNECVDNLKNCVTEKCESNKVRCPDGSCQANKTLCQTLTSSCAKGEVKCPDNSCKATFDQCKASNGCPVEKPFKCANGACLASPIKGFGEEGCLPTVVCPKYKPYLCADGECVGDRNLCRVQNPCPPETPWRCPDLTCAGSSSACQSLTLCPVTNPILCSNGNCVENPMECKTAYEMFCPDDKPVFCASGKCVKRALECIDPELRSGGSLNSRRRVLVNGNTTVVDKKDAGCSDKYPFRCYDGSCRTNADNCPIREGCFDTSKPYRCQSGVCAADSEECQVLEQDLKKCVEGTVRCEDGICRDVCPNFQGCPLDRPVHCPNGYCGKTVAHCAQDAGCPLNAPFRCADNQCADKMFNCPRPIRSFQPELIQLTVSPIATKTIEFIQAGSSQVKYGKITVPAGAFLSINKTNTTHDEDVSLKGFVIRPVAQSEIMAYGNEIHPSQKDYTNKHFPLSLGKLEYHQTVRSSVVRLESVNRTDSIYKFPLILELEADVPINTNKSNDFCLASLDNYTRTWECHTRELYKEEFATKSKFAYPVEKDGIYAVIFNPEKYIPPAAEEECGWFCKNKYIILYVLLGLILAGLLFAYVMWRVSRYITKYRQAKKQMDNFRDQITEMEKAQTDVVGQTLRDKIEGITFTTNPAYSKGDKEGSDKRVELNTAIGALSARDRLLEENNKSLDERNKNLMNEIETLRKEKDSYKQVGSIEGGGQGLKNASEFE